MTWHKAIETRQEPKPKEQVQNVLDNDYQKLGVYYFLLLFYIRLEYDAEEHAQCSLPSHSTFVLFVLF